MGLDRQRSEDSIPTQTRQRRKYTNFSNTILELKPQALHQQGLKLELPQRSRQGVWRSLGTQPVTCPTPGGSRAAGSDICAKVAVGPRTPPRNRRLTWAWKPEQQSAVPSSLQSFPSKKLQKKRISTALRASKCPPLPGQCLSQLLTTDRDKNIKNC